MVIIRQLTFAYAASNFALEIANLEIDQAEKVAFVGPSGCGKTTLLNLISGNLTPDRGDITTCGRELAGMPPAAIRNFRLTAIGQVFQEFELLDYLSVLDNVLLPLQMSDSSPQDPSIRDRANQLLHQVGLDDRSRDFPGKMSQGEKQRVAIARAMIARPKLILADEPTGNLDPSNKSKVLDLLADQADRVNATLLTVTHDTSLLDRFDRVIDFSAFTAFHAA